MPRVPGFGLTGLAALGGGLLLAVYIPAWAEPPAAPIPAPSAREPADVAGEIDLGEIDVQGTAPAPAPSSPPVSAPPPVDTPPPTRSGAQEQVLTAPQIAASGAQTLDELLQRTAGFTVSDTFTGEAVNFQGLPSKFATVLVDGQRLPGSIMDRVDFRQLPLDNVERIEILRGPQAGVYSGSSIGAVLNIITRVPPGGETAGSFTAGAGSLGWRRAQLVLHGGSDDGRERWLLSLGHAGRHAYDLDARQPDTDGDSYRQYDLLAKYSQDFGSNSLRLQLDSFDEWRRGLTFAPPDLIRNNDTSTHRFQLDGAWRWGLAAGGSLELRHSYGTYDHALHRYYVGFEPQSSVRTGFTDQVQDTQLAYQQRPGGEGLTVGLQHSYDRLTSDRIDNGGLHTAHTTAEAAYAGYTWDLAPRWTAVAGLRYEDQASFGRAVTPRASLRYALDARSSLSAAAGRGQRAPSLREQYYEFASPFGYSVIGNPNLAEETSRDYNFDYDYTGQQGTAHAGAFYHDVHNLIDFSQVQASPQVFQTVNVGQARTYGLELSAERRWSLAWDKRGQPSRSWGMGVDSTWIAHGADEATGHRLPNSPAWSHAARLFYHETARELDAQLLVHSVGARYLDLENTDQAPGYSTLDATLSRAYNGGRLELTGLNLLDKRDGRYGPEPGRELRAEYTWEF